MPDEPKKKRQPNAGCFTKGDARIAPIAARADADLPPPADPLDELEALEWVCSGKRPRSFLEKAFLREMGKSPSVVTERLRKLRHGRESVGAPGTMLRPKAGAECPTCGRVVPGPDMGTKRALDLIDELVAKGKAEETG